MKYNEIVITEFRTKVFGSLLILCILGGIVLSIRSLQNSKIKEQNSMPAPLHISEHALETPQLLETESIPALTEVFEPAPSSVVIDCLDLVSRDTDLIISVVLSSTSYNLEKVSENGCTTTFVALDSSLTISILLDSGGFYVTENSPFTFFEYLPNTKIKPLPFPQDSQSSPYIVAHSSSLSPDTVFFTNFATNNPEECSYMRSLGETITGCGLNIIQIPIQGLESVPSQGLRVSCKGNITTCLAVFSDLEVKYASISPA